MAAFKVLAIVLLADRVYMFVPFGVETMGPWGPAAHGLYRDLAKRLVEASGVQNAGIYFAQKLSIAIQRGNAASILGTACSALPNRIVGGSPTTIDRYPSIVQVDFLGVFSGVWGQSCAGSILNSRYLLSAAHCFEGMFYQPSYRRIRAGSTYRNTGGIISDVVREYNHPSYGLQSYDGDISVVLLGTTLTYSPVVQPVTIISQGSAIPANLPVVHAGWGAVSQGGAASPQLLDVTIYTVDNAICAERYWPSIVTDNMICAGILDVGGADACQGDSGGPLYYSDILVGVVSWGRGCAQAYYPGVSTRVASYTEWIKRTAS